ncbi:exosortase/archaeosortase family protein [Rubritalea marina]|uniref:exosortase Z n=1 Tax=Rubritalea marina TaxID=361055 RepID=UPI00037BD8EA|nr:exosortase/archaeosortase family protein [Rubritalea marina]
MTPPSSNSQEKPPLWKGLIPLIIVSLLASQETVVSAYGEICKPIALFILSLFGLSTADHGSYMNVAHLQVPWTRDCAGMNLLLVLLAIFAWMNRNVKQDRRYWLRMLAVIPPAIAANVLRVLTLVMYRFAVYPEVESPQLHYFFGFIWLIPFALLSIPRQAQHAKKAFWFELLHISAILGLLAPLLSLPNHWITAVGALLCMVNSRFTETFHKRHIVAIAVWALLAFAIAWAGIESLWLPWLLISPLTINFRWLMRPAGIACVATACPLFVLIPGSNVLASVIFAYLAYDWYRRSETHAIDAPNRLSLNWERLLTTVSAPLLFLPFLAAILFTLNSESLVPPDNVQKRVIEGMGYELKIEGQPAKLGLIWYDAQGSDRHHAVEVCLKYRGIELEPADVPSVKTDGKHWYCEYFIVSHKLIQDHQSYVKQTFGFRQDPGVHLILIAKNQDFSAEDFAEQSREVATQLFNNIKKPSVASTTP